jgi:hypothetical protein
MNLGTPTISPVPLCDPTPTISPPTPNRGLADGGEGGAKSADGDGDPADCAAYRALLARVAVAKTLRLTFLVGLPRGGTTAFERFVFEGLEHPSSHDGDGKPRSFDLNINQPGLLVRDSSPGRTRCRQATLWGNVLAPVLAAEAAAEAAGRNLRAAPLLVVVKETSNVVVPGASELGRWRRLSHVLLLIVRNPLLQAESRILCVADRILTGAMRPGLGIGEELDPRSFKVHGKPLLAPGTDLSHVDFGAFARAPDGSDNLVRAGHGGGGDGGGDLNLPPFPWAQHYTWMKQRRDFSSLGDGFPEFAGLHPLFEERAMQSAIWRTYAASLPPRALRSALLLDGGRNMEEGAACAPTAAATTLPTTAALEAAIGAHLGTRLEQFGALPAWMREALFQWRFGWLCFDAQIAALPRVTPALCDGSGSGGAAAAAQCDVRVVDFSEAQAAPAHTKQLLEQLVFGASGGGGGGGGDGGDGGNGAAAADAPPPKRAKTAANGTDASATAAGSGRIPPPSLFDVGNGRSAEWDAWFHGPCFAQHAAQTCALKPPSKSPAALSAFPPFLRAPLPAWMHSYAAARADGRRLPCAPRAALRAVAGVDPVFDALEASPRTPVSELLALAREESELTE